MKKIIIPMTILLLCIGLATADTISGTLTAPGSSFDIQVCDNSAGSCTGGNTTTENWDELTVVEINLTLNPLTGGPIVNIEGNLDEMGGFSYDGFSTISGRVYSAANCSITNNDVALGSGSPEDFTIVIDMSAKTLEAIYNTTTVCKHQFTSTQLTKIHVNYGPPGTTFDLDYVVTSNVSAPAPTVITNITNCTGLQAIKDNPDLNYTLMNNIDCSDTVNWNGGLGFEPIVAFGGILEGDDYTISDLFINRSGYSALIYNASGSMYVQNITFDRPIIISNDSISATILARAQHIGATGTSGGAVYIYNCNVYNGSISGTTTGGIAGDIYKYVPRIFDCNVVDTNLTDSTTFAGGIIGRAYLSGVGMIERVYFKGNIIGTGNYKAGIIGYSRDHPEGVNKAWRMQARYLYVDEGTKIITDCSELTCQYIGGIVGYTRHNSLGANSYFYNAISHADITAIGNASRVGGIVGYLYGGGSSGANRMRANYVLATGYINITGTKLYDGALMGQGTGREEMKYSFFDNQTTGYSTYGSGYILNVYGNTTSNLYLQSGYEDNLWDFTTPLYAIYDGYTYPYLSNVPRSQPAAPHPPMVTINTLNKTITNQDNFSIQFTAVDAVDSTFNCSLKIDGIVNATLPSVNNNTLTSITPSWTDGFHNYHVVCSDTDDWFDISATNSILIDTLPPLIVSSSPSLWNDSLFGNFTMAITGNASNFELTNVTWIIYHPNSSVFMYNETDTANASSYAWDVEVNTTSLEDGIYTMSIFAEDTALNT